MKKYIPSYLKARHSANASRRVSFTVVRSTVRAYRVHMPPREVPISPDIEKLIQEACTELRAQAKPDISDVIRKIKARTGVALPYHTVRMRFQDKHVPPRQAHVSQQLFSHVVEGVLVDWLVFLRDTGQRVSRESIGEMVEALSGTKPNESWIMGLLRRHPEVKLGKRSALDLKRVLAFKKRTVHEHFDLLEGIVRKHEIPIENVYNMAQTGCQRGGRKKSNPVCFVRGSRRSMTIIECVCANGTYLPPGFIFSEKESAREWIEVDPGVG